jgi:hypothetical protein
MVSFQTLYNNIQQSAKMGTSTDDIYRLNWFVYTAMENILRAVN